jgi:hypothetical protein
MKQERPYFRREGGSSGGWTWKGYVIWWEHYPQYLPNQFRVVGPRENNDDATNRFFRDLKSAKAHVIREVQGVLARAEIHDVNRLRLIK